MKKIYVWLLVPSVLFLVFHLTQLKSPAGLQEIAAVFIGSIISGSVIGFILYLVYALTRKGRRKIL
ncbi:hypothetical protein [Metabacillus sp. RGM 3146]|uniref:hypothetical protein n=1 Tax=Metabacillus sp. RGM 3146 TaxID=3401092 RepID=UPI003B9C0366